ncbi:hypothetical protein SLNWT_0396 [Streptomyces albus]|uniref:Uncharacterized protein n=1 Tax=Streptomyces albus (strain ATCC 21838 / DSM 41398 / FERM P-419 / JCM 4703 / NBRC 107858) TaxID=1081613 RepID=A0A0B5ERK2_STRA4|nr:hypothetical protein SLNWT_0396 [Streptomyces albus]AYN30890.1 hypothetical protein DUI70_0387 [Streptomyces albus]
MCHLAAPFTEMVDCYCLSVFTRFGTLAPACRNGTNPWTRGRDRLLTACAYPGSMDQRPRYSRWAAK